MRRLIVSAAAIALLGTLVPASAATRQVFRLRALELHGEWGRAPTVTPPAGFAGEVFAHATIDAGRATQVEYGERTSGPFAYYNAQTYTYDAAGALVYLSTTVSANDEEDPVHVHIASTLGQGRLLARVHETVCTRQPDASYACTDDLAMIGGAWEANGVDNVRTRLHRVVRDDEAQTQTTIDSHSHTKTADATAAIDGVTLGASQAASLDRQFLNTIIVCYAECPAAAGGAVAAH